MFDEIPIHALIARAGAPGLEVAAAQKVLRERALVPATKLAVKNFETWKKLVETKRKEGKDLIASVTKKVKAMEDPDWIPDPYTIGEVKGAVDIFKAVVIDLKKQNQAYAHAFENGGFRGDWRKEIKKAFPQLEDGDIESVVGGPLQIRGQIISKNRAVLALRLRVEEYLKRSAILYRTAENARKKASKNAMGAHRAVGKSITDIDKHIDTCNGAIDKIEKRVKSIKGILKTQPKKWEITAKGLAAERDENGKKARGGLKTLKQELDLAQKVLDKTPQTPKELVGKLGEREKTAKALEKKIAKLMGEIETQNKDLKKEKIKV